MDSQAWNLWETGIRNLMDAWNVSFLAKKEARRNISYLTQLNLPEKVKWLVQESKNWEKDSSWEYGPAPKWEKIIVKKDELSRLQG